MTARENEVDTCNPRRLCTEPVYGGAAEAQQRSGFAMPPVSWRGDMRPRMALDQLAA